MMMADIDLPLNMAILGNPMNWLMIIIILLLVSYSAFVIWENAAFWPAIGEG